MNDTSMPAHAADSSPAPLPRTAMPSFADLNLPQPIMQSLERLKFTTPTPIQAQAIPPGLQGKDILGTAQTGTGKTLAFGIPLITKLMAASRGSALIMTPTRELAVQVLDALKQLLGPYSTIGTALLIGGESMPKQLDQLRRRPRLLVGTPGRINDHLVRGSLMLHDTQFLVLDEMDRMLDMGFEIQIEKILKFLPQQRQTLLFSATLPDNIQKLSQKYLREPVRISVGSTNATATKVTQEVVHTTDADKYGKLIEQLNARQGSIILFVKTKYGAEKMATRLSRAGHSADAIHGDLRQNKRDRVIQNFRDKKHRIMVATDIAARGLDIPHIEHVINYDLPQAPEDYIHRIGRTARAGAEGSAICFVTPADHDKWRAIQRLLNPNAAPEPRPQGQPGNGKTRHRRGSSGPKPHNNGSGNRDINGGSSDANSSKRRRFGPRHGFGKPRNAAA